MVSIKEFNTWESIKNIPNKTEPYIHLQTFQKSLQVDSRKLTFIHWTTQCTWARSNTTLLSIVWWYATEKVGSERQIFNQSHIIKAQTKKTKELKVFISFQISNALWKPNTYVGPDNYQLYWCTFSLYLVVLYGQWSNPSGVADLYNCCWSGFFFIFHLIATQKTDE